MKQETISKPLWKLLHDMAAELEEGFIDHRHGAYTISVPAAEARRLLKRYEAIRRKAPKT